MDDRVWYTSRSRVICLPNISHLNRFTGFRIKRGRWPGFEDQDAGFEGAGHPGMDARIPQRLGRSRQGFCSFRFWPSADAYPKPWTSQEEKVRPDDDEQEDIDGAGETVNRHNGEHSRRRDVFVIEC
jgi:hypothetical protein